MKLSKEQYQALLPIKDNLKLMKDAGYHRGMHSSVRKMVGDIHRDIMKSSGGHHCNSCLKEHMRLLSKLFFEYKDEPVKKSKED